MTRELLLLPGMMCDQRLFAPQQAALHSAGWQTHIGQFGPATRIDEIATTLLRHAPETFALAGLSMGGIVAMQMIRQAPERITHLALLDTNPCAELAERAELRPAQVRRVQTGQLSQVLRDELKPHYLADSARTEQIKQLCMDMALDLGPDVFAQQSQALMSRPDQTDTLRQVAVPTLILCGEEDRLCPPERHRMMHQLIPHSTLSIIPQAGHLPTLEQPEKTNEALLQWLNSK